MSRKRVISDRIAELLFLAFQELGSCTRVAREMGYDRPAVVAALEGRGYDVKGQRGKRSRFSDAEVAKWLADYQEMKSLAKAAKANGVHFMTLYQILRKRGLIKPVERRLPEEVVDKIAEDYRLTKSLALTADRWGRTRQSIWDILHRRGLTIPKPKYKKVFYKGEAFTVGKNGYLRSTLATSREKGGSRLLHRVKWEDVHGPIPADRVIWFKDLNRENCEVDNLELLTRQEVRDRMTALKLNKNAWSVFYERHDMLLGELQEAMAGGDAAAIAKAKGAYEALKRPNVWTEERHRQHRELMKRIWGALSPKERRARALYAARRRRENRHAREGTALERMAA